MNKFAVMAFALALGLSSCKSEDPMKEPVSETPEPQQTAAVEGVAVEDPNTLKINQILKGFQSNLFRFIEKGDIHSKNFEDFLKLNLYEKFSEAGIDPDQLKEETKNRIEVELKTIFGQAEEKAKEKSNVEITQKGGEEHPYLNSFFSGPPGEEAKIVVEARKAAEAAQKADNAKKAADNAKTKADNAKAAADDAKKKADDAKKKAKKATKKAAETAAEKATTEAGKAKTAADEAEKAANTAADEAEKARKAKTADAAEKARKAAEKAADEAEKAKKAAETAKKAAETAAGIKTT